MSFINGIRSYATTSPIMTDCKIYVSFYQKSVIPLYRYMTKKNKMQQQNVIKLASAMIVICFK